MPGFPPELRDSLVLFFSTLGILQLYYLSVTLFPILRTYYPYGFIVHMSVYGAEFIILYLYVKIVKRSSFSDLGFRRSRKWTRYCIVGFLLAIFHNAIDLTVSIFILGIRHGFILPLYIHIPVYFTAFLLIGVSEEGIFRGCILGGLLKRYGVTASIIFSSLLFGLYHFSYPFLLDWPSGAIAITINMFYSFTAGLLLAYFYHKTGRNLLGPVSYHFSQAFFNAPYIWMEPAAISFGVQPLLQQFWWLFQWTPYVLNMIEILILGKIRLNE